ncbi:MAG: MFS transporter [Halobacteriales archaeon]
MNRRERAFALTIAGVHGVDHLLKRLFPPLVPIWGVVFGFPLWKLGVLMGARTFGSAIGMTPMGHLSDRYDRRLLLPAGFAVIGAGVVAVAVVPLVGVLDVELTIGSYTASGEFLVMLLAMLATGLGSSVVHPTGYPLITANVHEESKGKVLGLWGSASKFGDGAAPALVGALLIVLNWKWILAIVGLVGIGYAIALFVVLGRFETKPAGETDAGTAAEETASTDRDNREYLYPFIAVFAYFVIAIMAAGGVNVFLPEFITSTYGYRFSVAGISLTPESTASFYYSALLIIAGVAQLGTGELADRYDKRSLIVVYLGVATATLIALATISLSPVLLFVALVVLGTSLFGINPARDGLVSDITPPEREGRTFGYIWTGALLASSVAPALIGYVGDVAGLRTAFLILAGGILLSAIPILLLMSDRVYVSIDETAAAEPEAD